jgi:hypothetical protein
VLPAEGEPALPRAVRAHLAQCDRCTTLLHDARAALAAAREAASVPEPSPLYWEHLAARVRRATVAEPLPARAWWAHQVWVPLLAGAAVVLVMVTLNLAGRTPGAGVLDVSSPESGAAAAVDGWEDLLAGVSMLSPEDVQSLAPWADSPVSLVADLTPEERDVFASLLEREMGVERP